MAFRVGDDHRVVGAAQVPAAAERDLSPVAIVLHSTAEPTLAETLAILLARGFSYHVLIDLDGSLHQMVPFDRMAMHAGRSNWKPAGALGNESSLNRTAIGISMVNLGGLRHRAGGRVFRDLENGIPAGPSATLEDARVLPTPYDPSAPSHWLPFGDAQLASCRALIEALLVRYPAITELAGHDDIAIGHKTDPGPLCPVTQWRAEFGLAGGPGFATATRHGDVPIHDAPGGAGRVLACLPRATLLHIRAIAYAPPGRGLIPQPRWRGLSAWASVDLGGHGAHSGFVHMRHLAAAPLRDDYLVALAAAP